MTTANIAISIGVSIAQVTLVLSGYGIASLASITLISTIAGGLLTRYVITSKLPGIRFRRSAVNGLTARELLRFGMRNATVAICGTIAYGSDALIIGLLLPISNVSHYIIASKLVNMVRTLTTKPIDVLMPTYAHSHALNDINRQFRLYTQSVSLALGIALPFAIMMCAFGNRIVYAWVGVGHEASYPILAVLVLALIFQLPGHASFALMTGTEKNTFLVKSGVVSGVCNLVLSIALTRLLGAVGVALGSLLTVGIIDFIVLPCYVSQLLHRRPLNYVRASLIPFLLPTICSILLAVLLHSIAMPYSGMGTLMLCVTVGILFWSLWLSVGMGKSSRVRILSTIVRCRRVFVGLGHSRVG